MLVSLGMKGFNEERGLKENWGNVGLFIFQLAFEQLCLFIV